jgi:bla regulator protein BlaR1
MNATAAFFLAILNSLWEAVIVALLVWLALRCMPRMNAATRYAVWWAVLLVVIALPFAPRVSWSWNGRPSASMRVAGASNVTRPPAQSSEAIVIIPEKRTRVWPGFVFAVWGAVLLWRLGRITRSYFYLRGIRRRAATSAHVFPAISRRVSLLVSGEAASPMAIGYLPPAVILPETLWSELSATEREHVLLHELAHLARRDDWTNLAARIAGAVLALHPVAVWILRQIEREREMACDDWVVARTGTPRPYAESLARVAELRWARGTDALASGVFGGASRLGERIEKLLRGRIFSARLSLRHITASAGVLIVIAFAASSAPRWIALAQEQPAFEVATVRRDVSGQPGPLFDMFPNLTVERATLKALIRMAYRVHYFQISGGPDWIDSDRYNIQAKTEGAPKPGPEGLTLQRLRLQRLVAERFKLAVHTERKELPIYELTVAKRGPRLQAPNCIQRDPGDRTIAPGKTMRDYCGFGGWSNGRYEATAGNMADLTGGLSDLLERVVVDHTGIKGTFHIQLTYAPDDSTIRLPDLPGAPPPPVDGPNVFTALEEQLGLKLEAAKGPVEVLVIDHAEKPDAN